MLAQFFRYPRSTRAGVSIRETHLGSFTRHGYNDLRERLGPSCRLLTSGRSIRKPLMCCFKRKLATGATNCIGTIAPRLMIRKFIDSRSLNGFLALDNG